MHFKLKQKDMQTKVTLDIDKQTIELANLYAGEKGLSLNEMLGYYLKWIVWNEAFMRTPNIIKNISPIKKERTTDNWKNLENFLSENRFDLPENYKFNRDELYDR